MSGSGTVSLLLFGAGLVVLALCWLACMHLGHGNKAGSGHAFEHARSPRAIQGSS